MTELKTAMHNMFRMAAISVVSLVLSGCDGGLCLFGDGSSCFSAGSKKEHQGYHAEAADYYGKGCVLGDSASCNRAGEIWVGGDVPANYYKAVEMFRAGCRNGISDSCRRLGLIYRDQFG
ncbi:MAG: sel1 repeat family protein, partial [Ruminobacter sp.]|nr:sel1 repeat family protein [Ruminobacter sp.]